MNRARRRPARRTCSFAGFVCAAPVTCVVPNYWTRGSVAAEVHGTTSRPFCAAHGEAFAAAHPELRVVPLAEPTHCGGCAGTGEVRNPNTGRSEPHAVCHGRGVR